MLSQGNVDNAVTATMAFGGSTNAIPHLIAMARRAGLSLDLDRFDAISRRVPLIANLRPNNGEYLMEDFFYAGGSRAFLSRLAPFLDVDAKTVSGQTLGEDIAGAEVYNDDVIRPLNNPINPEGGVAVLRGNLAPRGAVIKHSAADPRLLLHTGPAIVFENYDHMNAKLDDPSLDVTPDSVLVLKSAGPQGGPGFPEWGMLPLPKKMLQQGVRDMVRISDSRMSQATERASSTLLRKVISAGRSPLCRTVTRFDSTLPADVSTYLLSRARWSSERRHGSSHRKGIRAVTRPYSLSE